MEFIILQSFTNYVEANIVMGRMEEEGINCWLKDENTATVFPVLSNAVGGIKLMVAQDQFDKALELFNEFAAEKRKAYSCPECGSHNIEYIASTRKTINWLTAFFTWLLSSYAVGAEQIWHCFNCNAEFEEPVGMSDAEALGDA